MHLSSLGSFKVTKVRHVWSMTIMYRYMCYMSTSHHVSRMNFNRSPLFNLFVFQATNTTLFLVFLVWWAAANNNDQCRELQRQEKIVERRQNRWICLVICLLTMTVLILSSVRIPNFSRRARDQILHFIMLTVWFHDIYWIIFIAIFGNCLILTANSQVFLRAEWNSSFGVWSKEQIIADLNLICNQWILKVNSVGWSESQQLTRH